MVDEARAFAVEAHGSQRYGEHPYAVHLDAVAALAEPYGQAARVVAYLHDVVEDTPVELQEIEERFGELVARCVAILTDEPGQSRTERKRKTYAKMASVSDELHLALMVKAADRLANMRACVEDDRADKITMYRDEHDAFRRAAFRPGLCDDLWREMERIVDSGPRV